MVGPRSLYLESGVTTGHSSFMMIRVQPWLFRELTNTLCRTSQRDIGSLALPLPREVPSGSFVAPRTTTSEPQTEAKSKAVQFKCYQRRRPRILATNLIAYTFYTNALGAPGSESWTWYDHMMKHVRRIPITAVGEDQRRYRIMTLVAQVTMLDSDRAIISRQINDQIWLALCWRIL